MSSRRCVGAIDACMAALHERFDQEICSILTNIKTFLIQWLAANAYTFELSDVVKPFT